MPIFCERAFWPITVYKIRGVVSALDMEGYLGEMDDDLTRSARESSRHVVIVDTEGMAEQDPSLRAQMSEWFEKRQPLVQSFRAGLAYVVVDDARHATLKSVSNLKSYRFPFEVCDSLGDAMIWATKLVDEQGQAA